MGRHRLGEGRTAGEDRAVLMLDDVTRGLEPFAWPDAVVGEGAIPSLDERDAPVLFPVGADAIGDRFPALQAAAERLSPVEAAP